MRTPTIPAHAVVPAMPFRVGAHLSAVAQRLAMRSVAPRYSGDLVPPSPPADQATARQDQAGQDLHLASAPLPVGRLRHLEVVHASDVFDGPVAAAAMTGETSASRCFLSLKSIIL